MLRCMAIACMLSWECKVLMEHGAGTIRPRAETGLVKLSHAAALACAQGPWRGGRPARAAAWQVIRVQQVGPCGGAPARM